jgi:hypothetical protein
VFPISLAVWQSMRGVGVTRFGLTPVDLWRNTALLSQGLIYPVAPLAQALVHHVMVDPVVGVWLVAVPTVTLLAWRALRRDADTFLLGLAWCTLFAAPPLVSMKADWFALAPRFLYMTAAGVSLIWTAALASWVAERAGPVRVVLTSVAVAALLTPAVLFVRDGLRLYRLAGESLWDAAEAVMRRHPVLLVNLPGRLTPNDRRYPLGFEGITPLPTRVTADGLAYVHTGTRNGASAVAFGVVAVDRTATYSYELFGRTVGWEEMADAARNARDAYLTRYQADRIYLVEAGGAEGPSADVAPAASFGNQVELLAGSATCDGHGYVRLTTRWRTRSDVEADVCVFAHLMDENDKVISQADGRPLLGMMPFWLWEPGDVLRDVRQFTPVASGEYTVGLGLWEPATGKRWEARGQPSGEVVVQVRCP